MSTAQRHPDTREVFFRNTDKSGASHCSMHWAWDVDHFTAITQARAHDEGGHAVRITKDQYLKDRK